MGNYAISFQGFTLSGAATILMHIEIPIQKKDRFDAIKLLAKSLRGRASISATIAYIKRRTKTSWVMTKVGNKKYPVFVFLASKDDTCILTENDQLLINDVVHYYRFPYKEFEVVPVYLD